MTKLIACAVQMVSTEDVQNNLMVAENLVREASSLGAQLVVLPENFAVLDSDNLYSWGEKQRNEGLFSHWLSQLSKTLGVWLIAGSVPMRITPEGNEVMGKRVLSASLVYGPGGEELARYDKMHLFDVQVADAQSQYHESKVIAPGDRLVDVALPMARIGLSICYDLRFPVLYSLLAARGCEILTVPAAFTYNTGEAHWEVLLRARAIEAQAYIIAPNQGGQHTPKRRTWGHSMIVDPWGKVLACVEEQGEGLALAELDLTRVKDLRQRMPIQQHARFHSGL